MTAPFIATPLPAQPAQSQVLIESVPITEALFKQFKADIGGPIQVFNIADYHNKARVGINTPAEDEDYMLRQKYGLLPPQLTHSERNLIQREEQRLARNK